MRLGQFTALLMTALLLGGCFSEQPPIYDTPYAVGSRTLFVYDETRPYDRVGGVKVGVRSLITEIWYPVEHKVVESQAYQKATVGDYSFGNKEVHRLMMTGTTFFHLTKETVADGVTLEQIDQAIDELFARPRGSYTDAPPAVGETVWPVVMMTHGDAGSRYNMETVCEYLAAHGYVVIAPEHTGNTPFSYTAQDPEIDRNLVEIKPLLNPDGTYGNPDNYGQSYTPLVENITDPVAIQRLDDSLMERVNDLRATLSKLDGLNRDGEFKGLLDLQNVGLMGRSFGGMTTLAALFLEPRFSAGIAVVPLVIPDIRALVPSQIIKPNSQESVLLAATGPAALNTITKPTMLLSGAEDGLIIAASAGFASLSAKPDLPTPDQRFPALRASYDGTDAPVIWSVLDDSNHSSYGVSGAYWWPQLKPQFQQRYFNREQTFKLIDPQLAHQIQKTKALQFFDTFLLEKQGSRSELLQNEFINQGLTLEHRNFNE